MPPRNSSVMEMLAEIQIMGCQSGVAFPDPYALSGERKIETALPQQRDEAFTLSAIFNTHMYILFNHSL